MRKQTHFKKVVSFALAAAMAVSVCTAALADEATTEATKEAAASEQVETQSDGETENDIALLTAEEGGRPVGLAAEGENEIAPQATNVAQIGDNTYDSVDAALNNAKSGDTVTLLSDATVSGRKFEETAITIDLQGHTLTLGGWLSSEINRNASLTIKNGKVVSTNRAAGDKADLIITAGSSIAIDNVEVDTKGSFLYPCGDAAHVTVTNSTIRCGVYAVATNAAAVANYNIIIDLQDSTFESKYGYQSPADGDSCVICMNVPGVLNMKNCKIMGTRQGVFVRGGNATIEDSAITLTEVNGSSLYGTPAQYIDSNWGSGDEVPMAALVVGNRVGNGSYKYPATCNLRNVTVTAPEGYKSVYTYGMDKDKSSNGRAVTLVYDEKTQFNGEFDVNNNVETVVLQKTETKPAEPETKVEGNVEDIKSENVDKKDVAGAAASTTITDSKDASASDVSDAVKNAATVKIGEEEVKLNDDKVVSAAKDAITEAAKDQSFDQDAATKNITIVAVPKLVVEPKAAANNDTDVSMTFDIKMLYDVKATVADDVKNMTESNTVTLEKNKEMPAEQVPTVAISLDVSALKIPADQKVFVRHVKEDGTVYYYEAETKTENGIVKTITFVNPDGFSEFTVMANKAVTVKVDGQDVTFTTDDIGKAFTAVPQDGYNWLGVSINGTVYTTFTKELYDAAYKGEALVGSNAYEEIAKPTPAPTAAPAAPVTTAAPTAAPTATPDDSQYYTCAACGHHNWTATADGYKCDTCGHLETKQISGYKNVKGTYAPTASSAKTAAATASTIPQTSDEMPIVPIAIIAIAALLGLGVTAYMKKKRN